MIPNLVGEGTTEEAPFAKYTGKLVRLVPIIRGDNDDRGTLCYVIWLAIEKAGDWGKIFYDSPEDPRRGDLYMWINYMTDRENPNVLSIFEDVETGALAGVVWFNSYDLDTGQAQIHIWVDPAFRGAATREIGEIATRYAFEVLKIKKLVGIAPYAATRNLAVRCGYREAKRWPVVDPYGATHTMYRVEKEVQTNG